MQVIKMKIRCAGSDFDPFAFLYLVTGIHKRTCSTIPPIPIRKQLRGGSNSGC
jgi:hypothetical protein